MDSFFSGGLLRTKDGLKGEAYELTTEVRQLHSSYKTLYSPIQELADTYNACKNDMALFRYKTLKDMIKTCVNTYEERKKEYKKKCSAKDSNLKGAGAFLEIATETNEIMAEVESLRKSELIQDIEEKKIRKERLKGKLQLLDNSIQSLRTEYTQSKQQLPGPRYRLMKNMIKRLIRTENLIP